MNEFYIAGYYSRDEFNKLLIINGNIVDVSELENGAHNLNDKITIIITKHGYDGEDKTFNCIIRDTASAIISYPTGTIEYIVDYRTHRDFEPALILQQSSFSRYREIWYCNGVDITTQVDKWIEENDLPHWKEWEDHHKVMYKLKFG